MQNNGVIYLPVVVKGATRVGGNVRKQETRHIHPMLVQCCVSVADGGSNNVPALGKHLLFATSWKGTVLLYSVYRPAYQTP